MKDYKMTAEQLQSLVDMANTHNQNVDHFINVALKEHFGSDKINASQWFEANRLISEQHFYERGMIVLNVLRTLGFDCKMDMQSNKLHCPEHGIRAY